MTITNGYATLADYKQYVSTRGLSGVVGADASDDAAIEMLIESASRYIDAETGRRFYKDANDGVYYFTAQSPRICYLPDFASITSVEVDYSGVRSYTALTSADYDVVPYNYAADGLPITAIVVSPLSSYGYFPTCERGIKITGKRGWSSVPTDIKHACIEIAQNIYASRSGQTSAGRVNITAAGVVVKPDDVPHYAAAIIAMYRMIV
jgi:hypothetical protein